MTVGLIEGVITLSGSCGVEEAEDLLVLVGEYPDNPVDIENAAWIHTALWQVLFMQRATLRGGEEGSFVVSHIIPSMRSKNP